MPSPFAEPPALDGRPDVPSAKCGPPILHISRRSACAEPPALDGRPDVPSAKCGPPILHISRRSACAEPPALDGRPDVPSAKCGPPVPIQLASDHEAQDLRRAAAGQQEARVAEVALNRDRKSTRLNSSHGYISYAVFCLKKKKK